MLRTVVRLSPNVVVPFLEHERHKHDYNMLEQIQPQKPITGMDRVKRMFSANEYDEMSVELHNVIQTSLFGAFIGACWGGFFKSRDAYFYFIENNQATIFKSTLQAKKKLQDYVTVAFAKGAYFWGWRLWAFSGIFSLIATTISVYRDETSLIEYVIAGAITGGIYKANLGLAASLVGAGLGGVLSTVGGLAILGVLKVSGVTMDDIRRALHKIKDAREDQLEQAKEKAATIKHDALTKHHDVMVAEKGEEKLEELK